MPDVLFDEQEKKEFAAISPVDWPKFGDFETMDLKRFSELWDRACRGHYADMLKRTRDYMQTALDNCVFPGGKTMQAVITEPYGPCYWPDHPDVSWEWYKHYNGDSARITAAMPFAGLSLSNYGEPLFTLWDDVDWHRNANHFIHAFKKFPPQNNLFFR